MKILILNWRDIKHPLAGGAEISLWEQAKFWQGKGAAITWFSSSFQGAKSEEIINGISVIRRGSHFTVHVLAYLYFLKHTLSSDTVVIDSFHFLPFFTPLYLRKQKIIALINETAREIWYKNLPLPFSWIGYHLEPLFFLFYKNIPFVTGSESAREDVAEFGVPKKNITVVHHGFTKVPVSAKVMKEKKPTVLFLSRLTKDKGIEDTIEAVSLLKDNIPQLQFWIGGKAESSNYEAHIRELIKKKDLTSSTTFFGYVSDEQKFELYTKAWVVVHPSTKEGWGLTVIEANSCGTPVIGYNVAGLRDSILDKKTGLLTKKNTPADLAEKLFLVLTDQNVREKLCINAKEWSEQFSWEAAGENSWHIIQSIYEKE